MDRIYKPFVFCSFGEKMSAISFSTTSPFLEPQNHNNFQVRKLNEPVIKNEKEEPTDLSDAEKRELQDLKRRDAEVRAHELAHTAAAGRFAKGGANFELERGPDGKFYAVGGHVNLDAGEEAEPRDTIDKMQTIRRAALAPGDPSAQDRSVAAKATVTEAKARRELFLENTDMLIGATEDEDEAKTEFTNGIDTFVTSQISEFSGNSSNVTSLESSISDAFNFGLDNKTEDGQVDIFA